MTNLGFLCDKGPPNTVGGSGSLSVHAVDFLHDSLGPLNGRCNQRFRPRARLRIEEIFRRLQMAGHQYPRHDRENSFASLVHGGSVSYSLFVRLFTSSSTSLSR